MKRSQRALAPALLALALALAVTGCQAGLGRSSRAIVGGTPDDGDPAVVAVMEGDFPFCTGTLIGAHTVLTAGHCFLNPDSIVFGSDVHAPARKVGIAQLLAHPMYTAEGKPYDLGLIRLAAPVSDVPVVEWNREALPQQDVGMPVRHVGFGTTNELDLLSGGTKQQVTYPIHVIDPLLIYSGDVGKQTCYGDSGGPALLALEGHEKIIGVVSDGPNCHEDGWDDRVDVDGVHDWIDATLAQWEAPAPAGCSVGGGRAPAAPLGLLAAVCALGWARTRARRHGREARRDAR